jgi:hypothetical protein
MSKHEERLGTLRRLMMPQACCGWDSRAPFQFWMKDTLKREQQTALLVVHALACPGETEYLLNKSAINQPKALNIDDTGRHNATSTR